MSEKKRGLGRGLDVLLGVPDVAVLEPAKASDSQVNNAHQASTTSTNSPAESFLPIEWLCPGKYQPRVDMSQGLLDELAESIKAHGVIQPLVVRAIGDNQYEIIAGERRWRASQLAGLAKVPVVVRDVDDETASAMALIENIQREDLNVMEEARGIQRLINDFGMTHQQIASVIGKSRTTITNLLRLITLEPEVTLLLERGDLDMGHARALLALAGDEQTQAARVVVAKGLSVRETERLVKVMVNQQQNEARQAMSPAPLPDVLRLQDQLSERLGAEIKIKHRNNGKGVLEIKYNSLDELDGVISHIH